MKKIGYILSLCLLFTACKSGGYVQQKNDMVDNASKELNAYPAAASGMERYVIFLDSKGNGDQENDFQVELITGKMMDVDCNQHTLTGTFVEKVVDGFQYPYYEFSSNGQAISTMMACPENILTSKFVAGQTLMARYNSKLPIVVYAPKGIEVKYRIWEAKELQQAGRGSEVKDDKNLAHFPKIENMEQYAILATPATREIEDERKIEIIPGKEMKVDCNRHNLIGTITEHMLKGFQYPYYEFQSTGEVASTRMMCADNKLTSKFIFGNTHITRYNSQLPIVVYAPAGIDVKYRIWEAKERQVASKN